jgi:hypothetical protein
MKKIVCACVYLFIIGSVLVFHPGCDGTNGDGEYLLTVTLNDGVTGNPPEGVQSYEANTIVNYNYFLENGYKNLQVTLDGVPVASNGVISIGTSDHFINATNSPWDVRGNWHGTLTDANNPESLSVTFSGSTATSGTTSGALSGPQGSGTFTVIGASINFTLVWGFGSFSFTGTLSSENHMSGNWVWSGGGTGTWVLSRI